MPSVAGRIEDASARSGESCAVARVPRGADGRPVGERAAAARAAAGAVSAVVTGIPASAGPCAPQVDTVPAHPHAPTGALLLTHGTCILMRRTVAAFLLIFYSY